MDWHPPPPPKPLPQPKDLVQALRRKHLKRVDAVLDKLQELALEGDVGAAKTLLSVVIPPLKPAGTPQPVHLGGTHDWQEMGAQLLALMAGGHLAPDAAKEMMGAIESYLNTLGRTVVAQEVEELKETIAHLHEKHRYR